jgi:hypothetical protein
MIISTINSDQDIMFSRAIRPVVRSHPLVSTVRAATFTSRVARPVASVAVTKARSSASIQQKKVELAASQVRPQSKTPSPVTDSVLLFARSIADMSLN